MPNSTMAESNFTTAMDTFQDLLLSTTPTSDNTTFLDMLTSITTQITPILEQLQNSTGNISVSSESPGYELNSSSSSGPSVTVLPPGENSNTNASVPMMLKRMGLPASLPAIIGLSLLFFIIVIIGISGNCLVIVVILTDLKMRQSVTNLLIINLAVADLIIMVFGVPEIVMYMMNRGWLLGPFPCKFNRFVLVVALYSSVISLVVLCIERFIGIVFPLKVHELCTRKKIVGVICVIWPVAILCGLPVAIFNRLSPRAPGFDLCQTIFPGDHFGLSEQLIYKYTESFMFYFLPMIIQVILYSIIAKRLFASNEELCTRFQMRPDGNKRNDSASDTIKARRGVVKMLISSVILYFISYSPIQVHLIYSTFARSSFMDSWHFFVFVMIITHINSAANPILYGIFSQNFRRNFKRCLCSCCACRQNEYKRARFDSHSQDSRLMSSRGSSSVGRTTFVSKV